MMVASRSARSGGTVAQPAARRAAAVRSFRMAVSSYSSFRFVLFTRFLHFSMSAWKNLMKFA